MFGVGWTELALIVLVIMLLFGANRLPAALGGLGKGIREFKKAVKGDDEAPEPQAQPPAALPAVALELQSGVGKHVRLLPDGTLEIGGPDGGTLVEVDATWVVVREDAGTGKIPLVQVKRIIYRA